MKALILAAGRGERMRPLTDTLPKPLLRAAGKPLIVYQIERLVAAGFVDLVINTAHLGGLLEQALGDGARFGARIGYSREGDVPLNTGGGIHHALPLLGSEPFVLVNGDIWAEYPFQDLPERLAGLAHLALIENPPHNPTGDFSLHGHRVGNDAGNRYTYSGIAVLRPDLFADCRPGIFPLAPLLREAASKGEVSGELFSGPWTDVGTPERLEELERALGQSGPRL